MEHPARQFDPKPHAPGLRDRKKARRRELILHEADKLFTVQGIEATTMAAIADAAGVSPPTVFNYFGSKDNLLSSLIFEGAAASRKRWRDDHKRQDKNLLDALTGFLGDVSDHTIRIAGKRVWRYAEAANIRHPNTPFEQQFVRLDNALTEELARFLNHRQLVLRNSQEPDCFFLAQLFFDRWNARYLDYIKNDAMTLPDHIDLIARDVAEMVSLLFHDDCIAAPHMRD